MGYLSILQRLLLLAFATAMLVSMPLFKAYGYGTNKNKVRVAPLPYFLHGLEQMDYVKKSKRLRGMTNDLGTWLHIPMVLADDYGVPQYLESKLGYKSIWRSKHKKTTSSKKSKKKRKKEEEEERKKQEEERRKGTLIQRARRWRDGLKEIKEMAKGDLVGVASGGVLILTSLIAPLIPAASQFVFIALLGMQVGVSRRNLPGSGLIDTFYYLVGLLVVVIILDQFIPDPAAMKRIAEAEAIKKEWKEAQRKKEKAKAVEAEALKKKNQPSTRKKRKNNKVKIGDDFDDMVNL